MLEASDDVVDGDSARLARQMLPSDVWDYLQGGAGEELTVAANEAAFSSTDLRPRVLVDVSQRVASTTLVGSRLDAPLGVAPIAYQRLFHPLGELAVARAAGSEGLLMVVSAFASSTLEEIAVVVAGANANDGCQTRRVLESLVIRPPQPEQPAAVPDERAMPRATADGAYNNKPTRQRAQAAGYEALVLTVDCPVMGRRPRDVRNGFHLPASIHPANLGRAIPSLYQAATGHSALAQATNDVVDPAISWRDLEEIRESTSLPLILKGVMTGEDARRAVEAGVSAIVVSNHGGRQLDGVAASLDALPEVVASAGGGCEVLLDGGVRHGSDVLRALALGARAVLVGRPVAWGLASAGQAGVGETLQRFKQELDTAMALCGCPTVQDAGPWLVRQSSRKPERLRPL